MSDDNLLLETEECLDEQDRSLTSVEVPINCIRSKPDNFEEISKVILNEYVGNLIIPKFKNKRLAIKHRNDKLGEIVSANGSNPILKKIDKTIYSRLDDIRQYTNYDWDLDTVRDVLPIDHRLKKINKLTSKQLR